MPEPVTIPISSIEYQARLERPNLGIFATQRAQIFEAVFDALFPFNLKLANVEISATGPLADQKMNYRIPDRGILFQIGAEDYKFVKEGSFWQTAEQDAQVFLAGEEAYLGTSGANVTSCQANIAMHLQPLSKTRNEILAPFVPEPIKPLLSNTEAKGFGNHLRWGNGDLLLDFSLAVANGIFVRFSAQFEGHPPLKDVLAKVRSDEAMIFKLLDVEEDTANG